MYFYLHPLEKIFLCNSNATAATKFVQALTCLLRCQTKNI